MVSFKERINNLKNIKKDWATVQNNPYAQQKFMYNAYKWLIIFIGILIVYQIVKMVMHTPSSGNNSTVVLTRAFMALVGVIIVFKLWGFLNQMKTNIKQYEANPHTIDNYLNEQKIDTNKEIDDILKKYDVKGGKK